jgi:hypothetical protein
LIVDSAHRAFSPVQGMLYTGSRLNFPEVGLLGGAYPAPDLQSGDLNNVGYECFLRKKLAFIVLLT